MVIRERERERERRTIQFLDGGSIDKMKCAWRTGTENGLFLIQSGMRKKEEGTEERKGNEMKERKR